MKSVYFLLLGLGFGLGLNAQIIQTVVPNFAEQGTIGLNVTITGANTEFTQASSTTIYFSQGATTLYAYNILVNNRQSLTADFDVPSTAPVGLYDLYVSSAAGPVTLNSAFTVNQGPPVSMSITPDTGCTGGELAVTITGQNTHFQQASETYFYIESQNGYTYQPVSQFVNSNINAIAFFSLPGAATGNYNFIGYNYFDGTITSTNSLYLMGPQIVSVNPDSGAINTTLDVTIAGLCTNFESASNTSVWINQNGFNVPVNFATPTDNNTLVANLTLTSSISVGYYNVFISYSGDTFYLPNSFFVDASGSLPLTPCNAKFVINATADTGVYTGYNLSTGNDLSYLWNFGDGTTSTSPYPTHNYDTAGFYSICLTVYNDSCSSTFCDSTFYAYKTTGAPIKSLTIMPTGIAQIASPTVSIFPNPATSVLMIQVSNMHATGIAVYDMNGRKALQQKFSNELDISTLTPGIYTLEISGAEGKIMKRLVKM